MKKKTLFLVIIILVAGFLRFWRLGIIPIGFTPDEASFGYDAYSILHTGKDQWGHFLPVTLESFGDFKSPLYSYISIPSVALFGLNEFAIRFPNALVGTISVLVLYLLSGEIGKIVKLEEKKITVLQLAGALILSLSSWHIMMSRGAFEANLITFFIPLGIYLFLKGIRLDRKYIIFSSFVFGLGLFTYHSAELLTPFIVLGVIFVFRKSILKNWKDYLIPLAVFGTFIMILIYSFRIGGNARVIERSITQGALDEGAKAKIQLIQNGMDPTLAKILHNKYQVILQRFASNYSEYFSIQFLFAKGPAETTYGMIPGIGVLYIFEGILLLGIVPLLIMTKTFRKIILVMMIWLAFAPLPAALATGVGYAGNRAEGMIPALQILVTFGFLGWNIFFEKIRQRIRLLVFFVFGIIIAYNFIPALKLYFIESPNIAARGMLYGRSEAVRYSEKNKNNYSNIIFSRSLSEPQIYIAFYSKYDPVKYQKESENWAIYRSEGLSFLDQLPEYYLGEYTFKNINTKTDFKEGYLLIGKFDDFTRETSAIKEITYPNGEMNILVVKP